MQQVSRAGGVLLAFLAWLAAGPAHASTVMPMNIVDLLQHSDTIVAGRVQKVADGFDAKGIPYTEVTLQVMDPVRNVSGKTYTFRQFGLEKPRTLPDGRVYLGRPAEWPTWHKDEAAVLFLYPKARYTGLRTTVGLGYGKLSIANERVMSAHDNRGLFQDVKINRALLDESERHMLETREGPVDAATFRKFLHHAVDGNWVNNGSMGHDQR